MKFILTLLLLTLPLGARAVDPQSTIASRLEFRLTHPRLSALPKPPALSDVPLGCDIMEMTIDGNDHHPTSVYYVVKRVPEMTDKEISYAETEKNQSGVYQIRLHLTKIGSLRIAEITEANIGQHLAIVFDGRLRAAPKITTRIVSDVVTINGSFTAREALELANILNAPTPIPAKEK